MPQTKKKVESKKKMKLQGLTPAVSSPRFGGARRIEEALATEVFDTDGKVVGQVELPKEIFGVKVNNELMAQAVRVFLATQRQGTASTKTRGEIKLSTRKIYRQKGTGRARHGAKSAPIFVGGGVAHGPKPRDFSLKIPKKMKRNALFSALTLKLKEGGIKIIEGLEKIKPKTREVAKTLTNLKLKPINKSGSKTKLLLIMPAKTENIYRAARNIANVTLIPANLLNAYSVLAAKNLLVMKESLPVVEKTFLKKADKGPKDEK